MLYCFFLQIEVGKKRKEAPSASQKGKSKKVSNH